MERLIVKIILLCVLCLALCTLPGCDEPEGIVGADVGDGREGTSFSKVFYADRDTSLAFPPPNTGNSAHLYVGSTDGITTKSLIRFNRPSMPDEWTLLDSSRIELYYRKGIGLGTNPKVIVRRVDLIWAEGDIIDPAAITNGDTLTVSDITQADSGRVTLYPGFDLIMSLIDTTDSDSLTIVMEASDAIDRMMNFCSQTAIEETIAEDDTIGREPLLVKPRLYVYVTSPDTSGELDTLELVTLANADLFIAEYDTAAGSDTLFVGSGAVFRSFLHFDLDSIDSDHYYNVINRTVLTLHWKQFDTPLPMTLALKPYCFEFESSDNLRAIELKNIVNDNTPADTTSTSIKFFITNAAHNWLQGNYADGWLALHSAEEGSNIDRISFYSSESDSAFKPSLQVDITRFER